jgi:hypothetical protein
VFPRVEFTAKTVSRARRSSGEVAGSCTKKETADERGNVREWIFFKH